LVDYAPARISCPQVEPAIRAPLDVGPREKEWLKKRRPKTIPHMREFFRRANIPGFNSDAYMDQVSASESNLPNIGIAMSGGGYRALLVGAGAMAAFDDRTDGSMEPGHLGGLLQSSTYVSGLSGGGWLVGSLWVNNFTSVQDILSGHSKKKVSMWDFGRSMLEGPKISWFPMFSTVDYWKNIYNQVMSKKRAGFDISITDYWARSLSYQMINQTQGDPGMSC
jgi:lysophospholipase